jgi:phosphopantothenoylcysteine decarboxylase/phosphopantothenate--cysteine ligase
LRNYLQREKKEKKQKTLNSNNGTVLKGKSILLGITGSVAAYKSVDLIRRLKDKGASVRVIMTESACRFITPLSVELASGERACLDMFESPLSHISLPAEADVLVVAPATANSISKYACGIADNLLSAAMLAFSGPPDRIIFAPAMNWRMYENHVFQKNLRDLIQTGARFIGPEKGSLACGEEGAGRMAGIDRIIESIKTSLSKQDLAGEHVLVTAGPTREHIDPVRYISNRSSGKMGYAIAKIAKRRGAEVTLISGPVSLRPPDDVAVINVGTAAEMFSAVMDNIHMSSIFVMSAAVADFMPQETKRDKIEKKESLALQLIKTKDILGEVGRLKKRPFTAGFAAEIGLRLDRAKKKLIGKNIDIIVFNNVAGVGAGFDVNTNEVVIIYRDSAGTIKEKPLPLMHKEDVAEAIFDTIKDLGYKQF